MYRPESRHQHSEICSRPSQSRARRRYCRSLFIASPPVGVRNIAINMFVCLSLSLSDSMSVRSHVKVRISARYLQSTRLCHPPGGNTICYVIPAVWITSRLHAMKASNYACHVGDTLATH